MKLQFAFLADAATITNDGQFAVVGGGFDVLRPHRFPALKSAMVLVGRVLFTPDEFGKTYRLDGEMVGPDGETLSPENCPHMRLDLTPSPHPSDPQRENWITICLNYQGVKFPTPGDYSFRLSIDGEILGEVKLEVCPAGDAK